MTEQEVMTATATRRLPTPAERSAKRAERKAHHQTAIRAIDVETAREELMKRPGWGTNWSWAALTAEAEGVVDG